MFQSQVIGNLGADAGLDKDNNDKQYAFFSIAHSEFTKDSNGQPVEKTVWIGVRWYGYTDRMLACLKKGTKVFISGNTKITAYIDKEGKPLVSITIYPDKLELCGVRNNNTAP